MGPLKGPTQRGERERGEAERLGTWLELRSHGFRKEIGLSLVPYARSRDTTEPAIVAALEKIGATVVRTNEIDLIVGFRGRTFLLECKGTRTPKTPFQKRLSSTWNGGPYVFIQTVEQALAVVTK